MMIATTCPYCNALLPAADGSARLICARCGESVAREILGPNSTPLPPSTARRIEPAQTRSRWKVVAAILAVLILAGATIAVWQTRFRSRPANVVNDGDHRVIRPVDVPGLGYLPASSDVVCSIQLPLLLEKLGPEAEADPAKALTRFGLPEIVVDTIEKASGVGLKNVDQLVVGIGLQKASLPPQVVVVVVTRQPFDFPDLIRKTKASTLKRNGRTLHVAKAVGAIQVYWWSPNNRVIVGALQPRDFDEIPAEPRTGIDDFRPEIVPLIRDRVSDDSCAWLVASSEKWAQHINPYVFLGIPPFKNREDLVSPAARLRSIVVSIPHPADRKTEIQIDSKDAKAAEELRTTLIERFAHEPIEVSGEGETCRVQTPFEIARISSVLARLLQEKK